MRAGTVFLVMLIGFFALTALLPNAAYAQDSEKKGGFLGIFNTKNSTSNSTPIYLDQGGSGNTAPARTRAAQPYQYKSGAQYRKVTTDDPFASAMADVDTKNMMNAEAAAAERQKITDMAMAAEMARIEQFRRTYEQTGTQPAAAKDTRKMVYEKKDTAPSKPARLFNLR